MAQVNLEALTSTFADPIAAVINEVSGEEVTSPTELNQVVLDVNQGRLDASSFAKLLTGAYVSVVYLYNSSADKQKHNPSGTVVAYIKQSAINQLKKKLTFVEKKNLTDEDLLDVVGDLSTRLIDSLKSGIAKLGVSFQELSDPFTKLNCVKEGADNPRKVVKGYEVSIYLFDVKAIVLTIAV